MKVTTKQTMKTKQNNTTKRTMKNTTKRRGLLRKQRLAIDKVIAASSLWPWSNTGLRDLPNGTAFILRGDRGDIRHCRLIGNLPTDINWKAQDLSSPSCRIFTLKDNSEFIVLSGVNKVQKSVRRANGNMELLPVGYDQESKILTFRL